MGLVYDDHTENTQMLAVMTLSIQTGHQKRYTEQYMHIYCMFVYICFNKHISFVENADFKQTIIVEVKNIFAASPVARQIGLSQKLSEQHPICHVLEHRSFGSAVLKTNTVTNLKEATRLRPSISPFLFKNYSLSVAISHILLSILSEPLELACTRQRILEILWVFFVFCTTETGL